ncbi:hypothetical protein GCM10009810_08070 [Nostocoides vanveenii]|uniref:Urease accessory protein UreD n=2 Tax=Nostocoides vanveenii TaxID=330835 RepID=A0ABN2K7X4_9MICO
MVNGTRMTTRAEPRTTRVAVQCHDGDARLTCHAGTFSARATSASGRLVSAVLVATEASLLGGDDLALEITVGAGCTVALTDVAAMVAYDGRGLGASWRVSIDLAAGACLDWRCEPLVVTDGAHVVRSLEARLAGDARLVVDETVVLGRTGQAGGQLECSTEVWRDGRPVLIEQVTYAGHAEVAASQRFVRGPSRCVRTRLDTGTGGTAVVEASRAAAEAGSAGSGLDAGDAVVLRLAAGGTVTRWLTQPA